MSGVVPASTLQFVLQLLTSLPSLIQSGSDVLSAILKARDSVQGMLDEGRAPTAQEWDELNAEINRLRGELHSGEAP